MNSGVFSLSQLMDAMFWGRKVVGPKMQGDGVAQWKTW